MKKIIYILVFTLAVAVFPACDEYLDTPPDTRTELNTKEKIADLLANAYPGRSSQLLGEMSSDNVDCNIRTNWSYYQFVEEEVFNWADATEKSWESPQWVWDSYYYSIATANLVLATIDEMGDTKELAPYKAEALLCRAYGHFVLVNLFAREYRDPAKSANDLGITYMEKMRTSIQSESQRESVAAVYAKINNDIEAALPLVSDAIFSGKPAQFHFNRKAAYAFATRFNLFYRNYEKAIQYATEVVGTAPAAVLHDWKAIGGFAWDLGTARSDAYLQDKATLLIFSVNSLWSRIIGPYTAGQKYAHNRKIASGETTDSETPWGYIKNIAQVPSSSFSAEVSKVCLILLHEYFRTTNPIENIGTPYAMEVPFTVEETLLCRAEAYTMLKNYTAAAQDLSALMSGYTKLANPTRTPEQINTYYGNMNYYVPLLPTPKKILHPDFAIEGGMQENMIHAILHLRRALFVHTGLRWYDIKRYGIEIQRRQVMGPSTLTLMTSVPKLVVDDPRRAIQLPQDVINAGMKPNPR